MRAKDAAITHLTPAYFKAKGACSRLEPQPKFLPPTTITPFFAFSGKFESKPSRACLARSYGSTRTRYFPGRITSVSIFLPNFMATPETLIFVMPPVFLGQ